MILTGKMMLSGPGEEAQCVRVLAPLAKDPGLVPNTHIGQFTIISNFSSRISDILVWLLQASNTCMIHTHMPQTKVNTFKKKENTFFRY